MTTINNISKTAATATPIKIKFLYTIAFLLSAFFVFGWLIFSVDVLWNDYPVYQLRYAQTYRYYLSLGIEPMWYPHIEFGMPAGGLVMAQAFHLPAWIISILPGYWDGNALKIISAKHILLCALAQGMLFFGLSRFAKLSAVLSFFLSFLLIYQMRTLDAIRYGTFNDAFTYFLVAFISGLHFLRSGKVFALIILTCAVQFMISCGYQPIVTYGGFAFVLVLPLLIPTFFKDSQWKNRILLSSGAIFIGFLLAAPHWLPFIDFLSMNAQRVGKTNIEWANQYSIVSNQSFPLNIIGYFTNLITPWLSEVHSGFGSSALYAWLILSILIYLLLTIRHNFITLLIFLSVFVYIAGIRGGLFPILYDYFPTIKLSRLPGRMGIIIPLLLFVISCRCIHQIRSSEIFKRKAKNAANLGSIVLLLLVGSAIFIISRSTENIGQFLPEYIPFKLNPHAWDYNSQFYWLMASALIGLLTIVINSDLVEKIAMVGDSAKSKMRVQTRIACSALFILAIFQTSYLARYGSWTRVRGGDPTYQEFEKADHLPLFGEYPLIAASVNKKGFGSATFPAAKFYQLSEDSLNSKCFYPIRDENEQISNIILPFYLSNEIICDISWEKAFTAVDPKTCNPQAAVLALNGNYACKIGIDPKRRGLNELSRLNRSSKITALTPNSIEMQVKTDVGSLLVTPYPLVAGWKAELDGKNADLLEVNGGMIAVAVTPGSHIIKLKFHSSKKAYSYLVVFLTAALLVGSAINLSLKNRNKNKIIFVVTIIYLLTLCSGYAAYLFWKQGFDKRVNTQILLNNSYDKLITLQLQKWQDLADQEKQLKIKNSG